MAVTGAGSDLIRFPPVRYALLGLSLIACLPARARAQSAEDLDGAEAIQRFFDDAMNHGHVDIGMWLRVNTTRPDHGRHLYFAAPDGKQWSNSPHIWGGDVRSGRGHVVMPPSTTETGMYTWVGEKLYGAPDWVIEGLRGGRVKDGSRDS